MPKEASYIVKVNNTNDNIQNTFIKSIRTMKKWENGSFTYVIANAIM